MFETTYSRKKETYKAYKNFFEMIKRKPKKKTILQN